METKVETKIENVFRIYKNELILKLGRKALSNDTIDKYGKLLFQSKYKGCYAQNEKFEHKQGYYIINTDIASGPGLHWTALILTSKIAYIYDSFSRDPKKLLPHLLQHLKNYKIVSSDRKDKEQRGDSATCGHNCLAFLLTAQKIGIKSAIKI
jgi:hypothetical protein